MSGGGLPRHSGKSSGKGKTLAAERFYSWRRERGRPWSCMSVSRRRRLVDPTGMRHASGANSSPVLVPLMSGAGTGSKPFLVGVANCAALFMGSGPLTIAFLFFQTEPNL
jgi:hypothetical protein